MKSRSLFHIQALLPVALKAKALGALKELMSKILTCQKEIGPGMTKRLTRV